MQHPCHRVWRRRGRLEVVVDNGVHRNADDRRAGDHSSDVDDEPVLLVDRAHVSEFGGKPADHPVIGRSGYDVRVHSRGIQGQRGDPFRHHVARGQDDGRSRPHGDAERRRERELFHDSDVGSREVRRQGDG